MAGTGPEAYTASTCAATQCMTQAEECNAARVACAPKKLSLVNGARSPDSLLPTGSGDVHCHLLGGILLLSVAASSSPSLPPPHSHLSRLSPSRIPHCPTPTPSPASHPLLPPLSSPLPQRLMQPSQGSRCCSCHPSRAPSSKPCSPCRHEKHHQRQQQRQRQRQPAERAGAFVPLSAGCGLRVWNAGGMDQRKGRG